MIPKNIHQIWLGKKRIPKHIKEYMDEIRDVHNDYEYFFWNDENLPKMSEKLKVIFDSLDHPAMKSDLLRVYVLFLYGGVYLDTDYKLISHLDNLECFNDSDAYIVCQESENIEDINNSILISSKKGDFIGFMLNDINSERQWLGPHWYAKCVYSYFDIKNKNSYKKIKEKCCDNNIGFLSERYVNEEVARHEFLASWYPNSEWQKKFETEDYD